MRSILILTNSLIFLSLSVLNIFSTSRENFAVSARLSPPLPRWSSFDLKVIVPPLVALLLVETKSGA